MMASVMQTLDNTIANVALPRIQGSLSATQDQMAWVLTSYIVAAAIMTPLSGWLAGRIGRKRVFLYSIAGFTVASMLCGLAQSLPQIVLARLAAGAVRRGTRADVAGGAARHQSAGASRARHVDLGHGRDLGADLRSRSRRLVDRELQLALGVLHQRARRAFSRFSALSAFMPEIAIRKSRFDFFGFAALSLAVGALQMMLDRGQLKDWFSSTEIWIEAAVAAVAFYLVHRAHADDDASSAS